VQAFGLIRLGRCQIVHRHHGERPHADHQRLPVHEEIRVVVRRGLRRVLVVRHDAEDEVEARHFVSMKETSSNAPERSLSTASPSAARSSIGTMRAVTRVVVHQRIVELDDLDLGLGIDRKKNPGLSAGVSELSESLEVERADRLR